MLWQRGDVALELRLRHLGLATRRFGKGFVTCLARLPGGKADGRSCFGRSLFDMLVVGLTSKPCSLRALLLLRLGPAPKFREIQSRLQQDGSGAFESCMLIQNVTHKLLGLRERQHGLAVCCGDGLQLGHSLPFNSSLCSLDRCAGFLLRCLDRLNGILRGSVCKSLAASIYCLLDIFLVLALYLVVSFGCTLFQLVNLCLLLADFHSQLQ
mmetsp:Transcript_61168/g.112062  ORF Transcript_61168/g.112062 Transcript_61168/m.112062 type:complete len:211 (-) Transcript_61168:4088-4720(-)